MKRVIEITRRISRKEVFPSQYGRVTGEEWCNLEVRRINRDGTRNMRVKLTPRTCEIVEEVEA